MAFLCHYALKMSTTIFFMGVYLPLKYSVENIVGIRPPVTADFNVAVTVYRA